MFRVLRQRPLTPDDALSDRLLCMQPTRLTNNVSILLAQAKALGGVRASGKGAGGRRGGLQVVATIVTIKHQGKTYEVECDGYESILEVWPDARSPLHQQNLGSPIPNHFQVCVSK